MDKVHQFKCGSCGKDVWSIWHSCPKCGSVLPAGETRTELPFQSWRYRKQ